MPHTFSTRAVCFTRRQKKTNPSAKSAMAKLRKGKRPQLSLANNMWIGAVPTQLAVLSLAERLLISLHFPACYIIKLYARSMGKSSSADAMNQGLRGNVASYKLNTDRIAEMVAGNLMPHPAEILAATIGITFVGGKNQPLRVFPKQVEVSRFRVHDALLWLKENNPLYANITISAETLQQLPESGVPDEIRTNVRYSENIDAVQREHQNYVPPEHEVEGDYDFEGLDEGEIFERGPNDGRRHQAIVEDGESTDEEDYDPEVIPLQNSSVLDTTGDEIPDIELFQHATANVAGHVGPADYLVRKSHGYVNEYGREDAEGNPIDGGPENPNHLLGAFPTLFPYGRGGVEVDRETKVPYETHIRWALQYDDGRFRKDIYFMFQAFGVIQKRQICRAACLQVKRSSFAVHKLAFQLMTPGDLMKASEEEAKNKPISNPVIKSLRKQLTSVRAKVDGTDESRVAIRAQIWGLTLRFNPPTIWATLNLSDIGDPVAQDENKLLLQRCANTLSRRHELSGPEVVSYLMNWGDRYISHQFTVVYWDEVTWAIRTSYPGISVARQMDDPPHHELAEGEPIAEPPARVQFVDGKLEIKDQLKDYTDRGRELDEMNMYDYFTLTYHGEELRGPDLTPDEEEDTLVKARTTSLIVASLIWLPLTVLAAGSSEESKRRTSYISWASGSPAPETLTMRDLQGTHDSIEQALTDFMSGATREQRRIVENLQYYHECGDSAKARREQEDALRSRSGNHDGTGAVDIASAGMSNLNFTEADVETARVPTDMPYEKCCMGNAHLPSHETAGYSKKRRRCHRLLARE
ncbi:ATP-dependent DNA helicase [Mycena indigotica]|uniref:ATP-dependent DNA helicase n=1 Tax=Mycena indigotica TaxID=2126181 RepID=A0A8H6W526_9AGAR|nr:ATP-dependent DNA helicase [Mycena indigotica]KAF7302073.1 ATP-dependent DNA helicase [Mycena indigotica]